MLEHVADDGEVCCSPPRADAARRRTRCPTTLPWPRIAHKFAAAVVARHSEEHPHGHALHQQLIPFPLGLLVTAVVFDMVYLVTSSGELANVAYWMIAAGIVGGLLAAPFGTIDWLAIPAGTRARKVGLLHGAGNVVVLVMFAASWLLRRNAPESPDTIALVLSFAAVVLAAATGWLGGELVDRHAVGVDEGAHLDSPNSLSGRPASERA